MNFCHKFVLFFAFLLSPIAVLSAANWVNEHLQLLSEEEQKCLNHLFAKAIKEDHLGHVLFFSNKPGCLTGAFLNKDPLFIKGWNVWKEKEYLFPHPNFIIHNELFGKEKEILHIYFINKNTFSHLLKAEENRLKRLYGRQFSKGYLIKCLERDEFHLFKKDEALMGLLLGFGLESAVAFKQKLKCLEPIFCADEGKIIPYQDLVIINGVIPVSFAGNPDSEEVKHLQKIYADELNKIEMLYQETDLLESVLDALCSI